MLWIFFWSKQQLERGVLSLSDWSKSIAPLESLSQEKRVCVTFQNMNPTDDCIYGPNDLGELDKGCQRCRITYGSATELKLHFAAVHQRQAFECIVCDKLFLQKFNFLAHIDRSHPDLGRNFPCRFCDRVSFWFDLLNSKCRLSYFKIEQFFEVTIVIFVIMFCTNWTFVLSVIKR